MKRANFEKEDVRRAIDESLSGVYFNAEDARRVLRGVRGREPERRGLPSPRRLRLDLAFALTLAVIVCAPVALLLVRAHSMRPVAVAPGASTPSPAATAEKRVLPEDAPSPESDGAANEGEAIRAALACFEQTCDTSVFTADEYTVDVSRQEDGADGAVYEVCMRSVYDNGCAFTVTVSLPSGRVLQHSAPQLATVPAYFDDSSAEVRSWYDKYGPYLFAWEASAQVEFSRRYEGAAIRAPRAGEMTREQAAQAALQAARKDGDAAALLGDSPVAYPVLYGAQDGSSARYVVYCFAHAVGAGAEGDCIVATMPAAGGTPSLRRLPREEWSASI